MDNKTVFELDWRALPRQLGRVFMKLTVKLDYACRVLAQLAKRYENGDVSRIEELATVEEAPSKYLAQILGELRNGGLVESRRGKQGGYLLGRAPEDVSLHEVIALIEGDLFSTVSKSTGESGAAVAKAWNQLQKTFEDSAKSVSLRDLVADQSEEMYYI